MIKVCLLAMLLALGIQGSATAHVLVSDTGDTTGVIIHVMPDDNPQAGKPTKIYIDSSILAKRITRPTLTIRDEAGGVVRSQLKLEETLATTTYTFPKQGVYELELAVQTPSKRYTFNHQQLVGNTESPEQPVWAVIGLTVSSALLACLLIIVFNRRRLILDQSR